MIRLEGIDKTFVDGHGSRVHALRGLDLTVERGETVCLIGASGCGKTTTLRLVNRLSEPSRGAVFVDGVDIATVDPVQLRRRMGYVIQSGGLFPHLDVERNVGLLGALEGWTSARIRARVDELLELVSLTPDAFRTRYPAQLSGGQRQRVCFARALFLDPPILLMDEPFGALDPITRSEVRAELRSLTHGSGRTVIVVTHDLDEAFELGDRIGLMHEGAIAQLGSRDEFRDPASDYVRRFVERHLHAK